MATALVGLALAAAPTTATTDCNLRSATLDSIADRVEQDGVRRVFVGERHDVGPVKRFVVDLANALVTRGHDVGLYVEGFRTDDCGPTALPCTDIARLFNEPAFAALLHKSWAPVRALDPPERNRRAERMAATLARGGEAIQVVLVGRSHVIHAGDATAEVPVYGGALNYPNPGDLVEAFPLRDSLTVSLETGTASSEPYALMTDGCDADYRLLTRERLEY